MEDHEDTEHDLTELICLCEKNLNKWESYQFSKDDKIEWVNLLLNDLKALNNSNQLSQYLDQYIRRFKPNRYRSGDEGEDVIENFCYIDENCISDHQIMVIKETASYSEIQSQTIFGNEVGEYIAESILTAFEKYRKECTSRDVDPKYTKLDSIFVNCIPFVKKKEVKLIPDALKKIYYGYLGVLIRIVRPQLIICFGKQLANIIYNRFNFKAPYVNPEVFENLLIRGKGGKPFELKYAGVQCPVIFSYNPFSIYQESINISFLDERNASGTIERFPLHQKWLNMIESIYSYLIERQKSLYERLLPVKRKDHPISNQEQEKKKKKPTPKKPAIPEKVDKNQSTLSGFIMPKLEAHDD